MKLIPTHEETLTMISKDDEKVVYESGWWMTRKDYDFINAVNEYGIPINRMRTILSRDKETKQITWTYMPHF